MENILITGATGSVADTIPVGSGNVVTGVSLDQSTKKLNIIKSKTLATVATSGSYNDIKNKPNLDAKADKSYVDDRVSGYESWTFTTLSGTTITKKVCIHN